tara:strand:- start:110 stop:490 length:381 start_codon:yes stop_codon:yes gene_type:complete
MKIDELKRTLDSLTSDLDNIENGDTLYTIESNASEVSSYADYIEQEVSNAQRAISDVRTELNCIVDNLDDLEGFDVDKVRQEVAEELIFKLTNKFGKFIKEALASDLYPDELKKAPAKKSTETDNQ